jgi:hypothetical protein
VNIKVRPIPDLPGFSLSARVLRVTPSYRCAFIRRNTATLGQQSTVIRSDC